MYKGTPNPGVFLYAIIFRLVVRYYLIFMEQNIFSPQIAPKVEDKLSSFFFTAAQNILVITFGLLPILFIPNVYTSLGFAKIYLIAIGIFVSLTLVILGVLRSGRFSVFLPKTLIFFWAFVAVAAVAATLSGDRLDAFTGNSFEIHTVGFLITLGLIMTAVLFLSQSKRTVIKLFLLLSISTIILQVFHLIRLFLGAETLSFGGLFPVSTSSLVGGLNDLAIFSGLVILVTLVLLPQLVQKTLGKVIATILIVNSLLFMAFINFYLIWVIVGFFSLLSALYFISKDTWLKSDEEVRVPTSYFTLTMVAIIFVSSAAFVVNGDYFGGKANAISGISYIEIRPSVDSTLDIAKAVYSNNALLGVGPNRFEDAWRLYKNPVINETAFWNTNFTSGSGYVPTIFVTTGIAGSLFFLIFFGTFLYTTYRNIFVREVTDTGWYLIGVISFVSATYLWVLSVVYVPGVAILCLTVLMTGLAVAAGVSSRKQKGLEVDVVGNKKYGFALITVALVLFAISTVALAGVSRQFIANATYINTVNNFSRGADFAATDAGLIKAQEMNPQDLFVAERAQLRLVEIARLNSLEATEENQALFTQMLSEGVELAQQAIALDITNPTNYILLSNFYNLLNPQEFDGIVARNEALFERVRELDPINPLYLVLLAQHKARLGEFDETRKHLMAAVNLKNNYTDALYLLSQLDIEEGNLESALRFASSLIVIEPNNPVRYFQAGLLLGADQKTNDAVIAFERAIALSSDYANARYFLSLAYLDLGRQEDALVQLRIILKDNQDSELVKNIIAQVEAGEYVRPDNSFGIPIGSSDGVVQDGDVTTADKASDTELITTINKQGTGAEDKPAEGSPATEGEENTSNDTEETSNDSATQ